MAREIVFEEQTLTGFSAFDDGVYGREMEAPFVPIIGETYAVMWDGTEHIYTAMDNGDSIIAIGDENADPFLVGFLPGSFTNLSIDLFTFVTVSTDESHTVAIYHVVEEVYYSVSSISLKTIGDAIRAKTGTTDPISFPTGMVEAIGGITSSGGSNLPEDVHQVTFMDGGQVLWVRSVADGDDCADVLTRGLIEMPTRESTVQYDYTYSGWSLTDGGEVSSEALAKVTADRNVYAAYTSAVRYYTITYYDTDGVTVLKTESLAYGSMPKYEPEKDGYTFKGWTSDLAAVTGDTSYTVSAWEEGYSFATSTWTEIASVSEAGEASTYFKVGDTRTEYIDADLGTVTFMIMGFDHDNLYDGSGKAGMSIAMSTNSASLYAAKTGLDALLSEHVKKVTKNEMTTGSANYSATQTTRNCTFFLLSAKELGLSFTQNNTTTWHNDGSAEYEAVTKGLYPVNSNTSGKYGYSLRGNYKYNSYSCTAIVIGNTAKIVSESMDGYNTYNRWGFCI